MWLPCERMNGERLGRFEWILSEIHFEVWTFLFVQMQPVQIDDRRLLTSRSEQLSGRWIYLPHYYDHVMKLYLNLLI